MSGVEQLEVRVVRLEEAEARRRDLWLESGLQGQAHGRGHADTQAIRTDVTELRAEFRTEMTEAKQQLADRSRGMAELP